MVGRVTPVISVRPPGRTAAKQVPGQVTPKVTGGGISLPVSGGPSYQELTFNDTLDGAAANAMRGSDDTSSQLVGPYIPGRYAHDIYWNNFGGDYFDSNDSPQGNTPYGSPVSVTTTGWKDFNVLTLVNRWVAGRPNYGFTIRALSGGNVNFASRIPYAADSATAPILRVTTATGTVDVACRRAIHLTNGVTGNSAGNAFVKVGVADGNALLWFDLSAYTGGITAATLRLNCLNVYGGGISAGVFETSNPANAAPIDTVHLGVADTYTNDVGLDGHSSILFVERFDSDTYRSRWAGWSEDWTPSYIASVATDSAYGYVDPPGGLRAVAFTLDVGRRAYGVVSAGWTPWRDLTYGEHVKALQHMQEGYIRYYTLFGTDWFPWVEGGKFLLGWDGRYLGNGAGRKIGGMGNSNGGTGCDGYTGWSARGAYSNCNPADTDSPAYNGAWLDYYDVYHIDQTGTIAIGAKSYGTASPWSKNYLGWLRRGRWYCVEQYIKLNTVTERPPQRILSLTAGPMSPTGIHTITAVLESPDTSMQTGDFKYITGALPITFNADGPDPPYSGTGFGNSGHVAVRITVVDSTHFTYNVALDKGYDGTLHPLPTNATGTIWAEHNIANPDGITRVWIDGRLAGEKTDWRFRASNWCREGNSWDAGQGKWVGTIPFGIDFIWLNIYTGGTGTSTSGGHCYMAAAALSTQYVGPMKTTTPDPAWLQGKAVKTWIPVNNVSVNGTRLTTMTDGAKLIAAGLTDSSWNHVGFGYPRGTASAGGLFAYSGGALKKAGSEMLIFGGGGAGAWAGNEVRALRLEDDAPAWRVVNDPSPKTAIHLAHEISLPEWQSYVLASSLTGSAVTSVTITATISAQCPPASGTLYVRRVSGAAAKLTYSSFSGSTFSGVVDTTTGLPANFSTDNVLSGTTVAVSFVEPSMQLSVALTTAGVTVVTVDSIPAYTPTFGRINVKHGTATTTTNTTVHDYISRTGTTFALATAADFSADPAAVGKQVTAAVVGQLGAYNLTYDGRPSPRHSYSQPQFIDATNTFYAIGCRQTWEWDTSTNAPFPVSSLSFDTLQWAPPGTHPNITFTPAADDCWCVKHGTTEMIYTASGNTVYRYDYTANAGAGGWASLAMTGVPGTAAGIGLVGCDHVHNRIFYMKGQTSPHTFATLDLTANQWVAATLATTTKVAPVDGVTNLATWIANRPATLRGGMVYDPGLDLHVLFIDDNYLYTFKWLANNSYEVDYIDRGSTYPPAGASWVGGSTPGIWTRMQYVPNLRGIVLVQAPDQPVWFMRTS